MGQNFHIYLRLGPRWLTPPPPPLLGSLSSTIVSVNKFWQKKSATYVNVPASTLRPWLLTNGYTIPVVLQ